MKTLGLGIIGLHHQHPRWYHPLWQHLTEYKLLAISDSDAEFLGSENEFFKLDAYTDYNEILKREDIDVVIIFLPHSQMPQAVEAAAAAGKHIIVEKPCAADLAGAEKIVEIANKYPDIKISSPYCWRNHPVSQKIKEALDSGQIGQITAMEGRLNAGTAQRYIRDNSPWMLNSSEGGGPMWNLGVHWIDYFRWITGKEIVKVTGATSGPIGEPKRDIEDNAQATLTFEDGSIAILDISYSLTDTYPGKRDIFVAFRGTKGATSWAPAWQGFTDELLLVDEKESQKLEIQSKEIPGYGGHMGWTWLKEFALAINENRQPSVTVNDILAAIKVTDDFYRTVKKSLQEG